MTSERLKAFSDGVLAIIITIMVLELKAPHGGNFVDLWPLWPTFLAYVLSFVYIGIYWNNHHHLFLLVEKVNGATLWANIHLLFWLSLLPFVTAWASDTEFARDPVALYGIVLLGAAVAYSILVMTLLRAQDGRTLLHAAIGRDVKGWTSNVLYVLGIAGACLHPWIGCLFYVAVAAIWLIPDRRIESRLNEAR
ncbi:TMEM175 family protein [Rhodoblastus acidophilus]|uniref:TMEM175 family protein n=1 Tax=Candidatus Rhodoblastus alkanivorans TaxID=2954117 RepID=A0ABS9Z420_9HYPH|nr:TMEM175 family protein [Candidatus Rhodoblastus alkanivorans]MCI4682423.1 TMEM175 family protein [Candidatus Rhodoblastus alkanivorans]MDI4639729.1 TMEM175 family protein [Rhodoblastus acidophilus]